MKFTLDVTDDLRVLRLHEKHLEAQASAELKSQLVMLFTAENLKYLAIDLSEVETIDSSGIGALLLAHRKAASIGGFSLLVSIRPAILDILKITGLSDQLYIFPSLKEAKKQIIVTDEDENPLSDIISSDIYEQFGLDENDKYINSIIDQADADFDGYSGGNVDFDGDDFYETLKVDDPIGVLDEIEEDEDEIEFQDFSDLLDIFGKKSKVKSSNKKKKTPLTKKKSIKTGVKSLKTSGKTTIPLAKKASGKKKK